MREYLLVLLASAAITYVTVPVVRWYAVRWNVMAEIRDRDVHDIPIPRLGGVAMYLGFLAGMLVASQLGFVSAVFSESRDAWAVITGGTLIFLVGVVDDVWGLDALTKAAGQIIAAGVMVLQGVQLLWLPFNGVTVLDYNSSFILTVLLVVVTVNAINFIDGLDGLAAGIIGIGSLGFFAFAYLLSVERGIDRATTATLLSAVLVGLCAGFLPHNFNAARIFMGDSGSMLAGLLLSASVITLTGKIDPFSVGDAALLPALMPLVLPFLVLAVPLMDLLLAVARRTRARRSPFAPDKQHLHHRLLEIGHSQRKAVLIMYVWAGALAVGTAIAAFQGVRIGLVIGIGLLLVAVILTRRPVRAIRVEGSE
ncbi:MAG TPA: MraY family glycosyltransferase [Thermomicrobiales bacterium]|nr:MraY family glycosyltransferase [Thermomicrobiales bacterium]